MANITIRQVRVAGISTCVPKQVERNTSLTQFNEDEIQKLIKMTGIEERRKVDDKTTTSDLCLKAAEKLIAELGWDSKDIDALVFVTQTPDYILPATSSILQNKLGLPLSCLTLDISSGCSGYINGLITLGKIMSGGGIKKCLLLVGDTISKICNPNDKSTYPLFGDAGTATALVFDPDAADIKCNIYSDGSGFNAIKIEDGGYRNPFNSNSLNESEIEENIIRSRSDLELDGMDVFSFGISKAPECVNNLLNDYSIDKNEVDYFIFHQANKFMNDTIRKKLVLKPEQVPSTLREFGNTSSASIPITICARIANEVKIQDKKLVLCGFGVGLSWGSIYLELNKIVCPDIIIYE